MVLGLAEVVAVATMVVVVRTVAMVAALMAMVRVTALAMALVMARVKAKKKVLAAVKVWSFASLDGVSLAMKKATFSTVRFAPIQNQ